MNDTQPAQWRQRREGRHLCLELDGEVRWTPDSTGEDSEPGEVPARTRKRKPSVASVIKQATKAGVTVARVEVDPDTGRISVISGTPGEATDGATLIARAQWN